MILVPLPPLESWSYNPSDGTCVGSVAAILVVEILVAVGSLAVILAVIWLWIRGRRVDDTDTMPGLAYEMCGDRDNAAVIITGPCTPHDACASKVEAIPAGAITRYERNSC